MEFKSVQNQHDFSTKVQKFNFGICQHDFKMQIVLFLYCVISLYNSVLDAKSSKVQLW
jgi:hypothetical protein